MRKIMVAAALAALPLSACGPTPEPEANVVENPVNAITGGNDASAVVEMSDGQRRLTFARAIVQLDLPCDGVTKAERLPDQGDLPLWRVTCKNGTAYAATVTPDGTVNLVSRRDRR